MQPDSVLHFVLGEFLLQLPSPLRLPGHCLALPCSALKINLPASPFALQSLSLPLPAAPHRGVFRGADVTVHVTAPSGPGLSMYRGSKESQEYQAILCSLGGDARSRSTQVPGRHGYPRSRKLPSTYGMGTERLPEHVSCTYLYGTVSAAAAELRGFVANPSHFAARSKGVRVRIQLSLG